jgi:hypothetical protein
MSETRGDGTVQISDDDLLYRLALIPDELQGRVNSAFRLIAFCGQPLGLAATGFLLETITVIPTIMIMFAGYLILAIMTTLNRDVRHAPPLAKAQGNLADPR